MRYVQFYHESTGWNGRDYSGPTKLIPRCGTDGVLPLDGRLSLDSCHRKAREQAARLYVRPLAYQIESGGRPYSGSRPITALIELESDA